jgi:aryl-alcohol dehydrogenase-like predicted oxidoreductase
MSIWEESFMNKRRLGKTDIEISPLGLGCWQFQQGKGVSGSMWSVLDQKSIDAIVERALEGGINWFDTAEAYGNGQSERTLSTALTNLNVESADVVIATKWLPLLRTAGSISRTIDKRLSCLQGYPVGLHQIHIPWSFSSINSQIREMAKILRAGKIRAIGVSNFSARKMEKASDALQKEGLVLASNEVLINLLDRRIEKNGVLETARRLGITLIAYSPLAQGLLTGKFHKNPDLVKRLPKGRRLFFSPQGRAFRSKNIARTRPLIEELNNIAEAHGASISQVALAWLITYYGDTVVAIPGASHAEQASDNAAAMRLELTHNELSQIDNLSARVARF